jgi:hypothetical protein
MEEEIRRITRIRELENWLRVLDSDGAERAICRAAAEITKLNSADLSVTATFLETMSVPGPDSEWETEHIAALRRFAELAEEEK